MKNVGILSVGHYLPSRKLTNLDLEKMVETSDEWIVTRTGIKERRIASQDELTSDMASGAAREALKNAEMDGEEIELIIIATTSPDSNFPSVACKVQKAINAKNAAAFDVSAACSGYLYAMTTAKQYILSGMFKNALVVAADKFSNLLDWNDRGTCVLFGDGAGACVLGWVRGNHGILSDHIHAQGKHDEMMYVDHEEPVPLDQTHQKMRKPHIIMHGQELFKEAVTSMAEGAGIVAKKAGVKLEDVKCVVPHQANDRIISAVAKKAGIPKEKFFINIHKYGNTSAAAVAIALYEAVQEGRIKKNDNVILVTFGAGLVSAANLVRW
ncbi:MAG: beta-ketoacyl-ACP synthase III [Candidatus Omnitrophota bacterium]